MGDPMGSDFHGLVIGPSQPCRVRYQRRQPQTARQSGGRAALRGTESTHTADPEPIEAIRANSFRVICDLDLCQSHAACMGEAPEVFRVGRVGKVSLLQEHPSPELRAKVEAAVNNCPTGTLRIEALPTNADL
jgi:sterol 14-demethylase